MIGWICCRRPSPADQLGCCSGAPARASRANTGAKKNATGADPPQEGDQSYGRRAPGIGAAPAACARLPDRGGNPRRAREAFLSVARLGGRQMSGASSTREPSCATQFPLGEGGGRARPSRARRLSLRAGPAAPLWRLWFGWHAGRYWRRADRLAHPGIRKRKTKLRPLVAEGGPRRIVHLGLPRWSWWRRCTRASTSGLKYPHPRLMCLSMLVVLSGLFGVVGLRHSAQEHPPPAERNWDPAANGRRPARHRPPAWSRGCSAARARRCEWVLALARTAVPGWAARPARRGPAPLANPRVAHTMLGDGAGNAASDGPRAAVATHRPAHDPARTDPPPAAPPRAARSVALRPRVCTVARARRPYRGT